MLILVTPRNKFNKIIFTTLEEQNILNSTIYAYMQMLNYSTVELIKNYHLLYELIVILHESLLYSCTLRDAMTD